MSFTITIGGTPIEMPSSGASPNWAPAIIEAFQAIESALTGVVGQYDVSPQVYTGDAQNPGTNIDLPSLSFANSTVRSAVINYSVYRTTSTSDAAEAGILTVVYNPNNGTNEKWEMTREYTGDGSITFNITDTGQVQFTTATLGGTGHYMRIGYSAK